MENQNPTCGCDCCGHEEGFCNCGCGCCSEPSEESEE